MLRSDQIASSSPPEVVPRRVRVPIAGDNPSTCTAAMSGGSWTCPRVVAPFKCASRFADFAAFNPVADCAFSPRNSATRWPVNLLGAHLGSKRSSIISGIALGGRPAAALARRLMLPVSKNTLLRVESGTAGRASCRSLASDGERQRFFPGSGATVDAPHPHGARQHYRRPGSADPCQTLAARRLSVAGGDLQPHPGDVLGLHPKAERPKIALVAVLHVVGGQFCGPVALVHPQRPHAVEPRPEAARPADLQSRPRLVRSVRQRQAGRS